MVYKNFRINCILRICILGLTLLSFFLILTQTTLYSALIILGFLIIYQTYALIHYVEKTNRDLTHFFDSIRYSDFSQSFKYEGRGQTFDSLKNSFTEVMNAFRKTRTEKEQQARYLQTVVRHIGVGLIVFQPDGEVELINKAAKQLLGINQLKNIKSLQSLSPKLVNTLLKLKPREKNTVKIDINNETLHLSVYGTEFKLGGNKYFLVSLQNIHSELEETEIEAWQKLIRVLTHEIMNSVTPISSLASTINGLVHKNMVSEALTDIKDAAQTIKKRSQGLMHFVDAYRNLTLIKKPNFQIFQIKELFLRVEKLMQKDFKDKGIQFLVKVQPQTLELTADTELIEQVLINLLLNAQQAVEGCENAEVNLEARLDKRGKIILEVTDNGPGIPNENMEKIFIPFFSTKEGGSGIGLSLSRQIMRLHKGSIGVHSQPYSETSITLIF
ncbi:MAG: ATP-binding protein [Candidatus Aminicenantes bacterium]|nr:ATP-binding protein [Candidatus Aminicenantes bacterium]